MKKTLFRMCLCLAILGTGITLSSCDENSTWLNIIKNLLGTNSTYTYTGDGSYECLEGTYNPMNYNRVGEFTVTSQYVQLTTTSSTTDMATIVLPAASSSGVSLSAITLSNLPMTSDNTATTLAVGDNSYIDGTFTYNGHTYTAANLYISKASATSGVITLEMTIYFGTANASGEYSDYTEAVNYKFTGRVVEQ